MPGQQMGVAYRVRVGERADLLASTQFFTARPELPPEPFVVRLSTTPPTVTAVEALTVVTPVALDVRVTEQEPVPPDVRQLAALSEPGPLAMAKLIVVLSGALTKPVPGFTFTCPVRVCESPIAFES